MRLLSRSLLLALVALATSVSIALAAMPKLGGVYVGTAGDNHPVRITVAHKPVKRGVYRGTFQYCGLKIAIRIVHGAFTARQMEPSIGVPVTEFKAHGSFTSRSTASGRIELDFSSNCQGQPGNFTATLR